MKSYPVLVFHLGEPLPAVHAVSCANDAEATLRAINLGQSRMEVWGPGGLSRYNCRAAQMEPAEIDACVPVPRPRAARGEERGYRVGVS
jgi:hypothetical protein